MEVETDSTKVLAQTANLVPGLPLALGGGSGDANVGNLKSAPDADDTWCGVGVDLPVNALMGRVPLGDFGSPKGKTLLAGRIRVRNFRAQRTNASGYGEEDEVSPWVGGVVPTIADAGKLLDAVVVAAVDPDTEIGSVKTNPFGAAIMKWRLHTTGSAGFSKVARLTVVSDDGSECEIEVLKSPLNGAVADPSVYQASIVD
jgi:hypothetical protein